MCEQRVAIRWPDLQRFALSVGATDLAEFQIGDLRLFAKLEWQNPSQSIKDRHALGMMHELLRRKNPSRILEYTDGPLGISLAKLTSLLKIPLLLVVSDATAASTLEQLGALHCEVITVPRALGFSGVLQKAIALAENYPEFSLLHQMENPASLLMHQLVTGPELLSQLGETAIDGFGTMISSGATFAGLQPPFLVSTRS